MTITSSGLGSKAIKTFDLLDQIVTVLGATKLAFYPFLSGHGTEAFPYGTGSDGLVLTASAALESVFDPMQHVGGVFSYYNDSSASGNLQAADNAAYLHAGAGGMSMGLWIYPTEAVGTKRSLISKYDATGAAEVREYTFDFDTSGNLVLELYDETNNASEIGTGASDIIVPFRWQFVVATYDGVAGTPGVHLYRNAVDQLSSGATTETGAFADMVDGAGAFGVGGQIRAGSVEQEFEGRIALPFITGKALTAANVTTLYGLGRTLLGI